MFQMVAKSNTAFHLFLGLSDSFPYHFTMITEHWSGDYRCPPVAKNWATLPQSRLLALKKDHYEWLCVKDDNKIYLWANPHTFKRLFERHIASIE